MDQSVCLSVGLLNILETRNLMQGFGKNDGSVSSNQSKWRNMLLVRGPGITRGQSAYFEVVGMQFICYNAQRAQGLGPNCFQ